MRDLNYCFGKETYERYYGVPLKYRTIKHEDIPNYVSSTTNFSDSIQKGENIEEDGER